MADPPNLRRITHSLSSITRSSEHAYQVYLLLSRVNLENHLIIYRANCYSSLWHCITLNMLWVISRLQINITNLHERLQICASFYISLGIIILRF